MVQRIVKLKAGQRSCLEMSTFVSLNGYDSRMIEYAFNIYIKIIPVQYWLHDDMNHFRSHSTT